MLKKVTQAKFWNFIEKFNGKHETRVRNEEYPCVAEYFSEGNLIGKIVAEIPEHGHSPIQKYFIKGEI